MSIVIIHHMLLGMHERIMCTNCKTLLGHRDSVFIKTVQVGGSFVDGRDTSQVTETLCERCDKKETK